MLNPYCIFWRSVEVSIPLDVAADLSLASPSLTFRATLHVTVLKSAPVAGTGILKTPRRVLFGLHSATMDAAAFRHWAMELAPMAGFEPAHLVGTYFPPALPLSYIGIEGVGHNYRRDPRRFQGG